MLYPNQGYGQAWSGLISVVEAPVDSVSSPRYQDGLRRSNRQTNGHFAGTINAYSAPEAFLDDVLAQVRPKSFGMSFRTTKPTGYKLHLLYNVLVSPSQYAHKQSDVESYSWNFTTLPVLVPGAQPTAHVVVEGGVAYPWIVEAIEDILYGTESEDARLPTPGELVTMFESFGILRVTDNGDGTWTAETEESGIISFPDADSFEINWPSAVYVTSDTYTLSTL